MDALKLFYEQQLDAKRRGPSTCSSGTSATPRAAEVEDKPKSGGCVVPAMAATEVRDAPESLLRHLEQHAGESLRSPAAIDTYLAALKKAGSDGASARRSLLRETALVLFLVVAVLQYYYIDVSLEIASLKRVTVFVPTEQSAKPRISES